MQTNILTRALPWRNPPEHLLQALKEREADLAEELTFIRSILKRWEKRESKSNLHHKLRNEGPSGAIMMRESCNANSEKPLRKTRKLKKEDWINNYVPSNYDLYNRLNTSLLDQDTE